MVYLCKTVMVSSSRRPDTLFGHFRWSYNQFCNCRLRHHRLRSSLWWACRRRTELFPAESSLSLRKTTKHLFNSFKRFEDIFKLQNEKKIKLNKVLEIDKAVVFVAATICRNVWQTLEVFWWRQCYFEKFYTNMKQKLRYSWNCEYLQAKKWLNDFEKFWRINITSKQS